MTRIVNGYAALATLLCVFFAAPTSILGQLTDEQIKQDIEWRYKQDLTLQGTNVEVQVENGRVTLSGTVPSFTARDVAINGAKSVADVKAVEAEGLKVERPPLPSPPSPPQAPAPPAP